MGGQRASRRNPGGGGLEIYRLSRGHLAAIARTPIGPGRPFVHGLLALPNRREDVDSHGHSRSGGGRQSSAHSFSTCLHAIRGDDGTTADRLNPISVGASTIRSPCGRCKGADIGHHKGRTVVQQTRPQQLHITMHIGNRVIKWESY